MHLSINWFPFLEKYRILQLTNSPNVYIICSRNPGNRRKLQSILKKWNNKNNVHFHFDAFLRRYYQSSKYDSDKSSRRPEFTLHRQINPKEYLKSIVTSFPRIPRWRGQNRTLSKGNYLRFVKDLKSFRDDEQKYTMWWSFALHRISFTNQ